MLRLLQFKWSTDCWVVSTIQQQTTRDTEIKLISHSSWRKTQQTLRGHMGLSLQSANGETGPGTHAFVRVCGQSAFGVPKLEPDWLIQTRGFW